MKKPLIISKKTCSSLFAGIIISDTQRKAQEKWLNLLENGKLEKEKENYPVFMNTILRDLLGFPEELIEKAYEQKNVEFVFKDPQGQWAALFEAKGHSTKNLHANQGRIKKNQQTPIKQTYDNLGRFEFIKYGVCTNYQKFILMDYNLKFSALQEFDFISTKNNDEKLKEFIGLFCYETLVINKDISKFKTDSDNADKELSIEFYKLFHETRLMLIKSFKEKEGVTDSEAMYYTQRFLERILFLFFALDNGLINNQKLFTDRILNQLKLQQCTEDSSKIFNDIKSIFTALDKGSKILGVEGFNGELFSGKFPDKIFFLDYQSKSFFANEIMNSKLSKELKLHGDAAKTWKEFGKNVNPIIRNLLIMDSRDFNSELNVTILGHILEQSLDDLSELQKTGSIKRKIDGVYYTPSTITDYICKNTIIPYLSKSNSNEVYDLILEYEDDIEKLEEKLSKIRIIDPACGSGAFLINAAKLLLEITEAIEITKTNDGVQKRSGTLEDWQVEKETSKIIKNNIFGADINRESVEITKLSLFLMMAKPGEKLTNLSKNILRRNSVIDDKEVDSNAIIWKNEFPEIMKSGGFDVVIGNPPWQVVKSDIDEFFSSLKEMKLQIILKYNESRPFSLLSKPVKNELVKKCLQDKTINLKYLEYLKYYNKQIEYFSSSKQYEIKGEGDINLYKLFIIKSLQILHPNGIFGMVLPASIYMDKGAEKLRDLIFKQTSNQELCGFINRKPIFHDVDTRQKFCTLIFTSGSGLSDHLLAKFHQIDDEKLIDFRSTAFEYKSDLLDLSLDKLSSFLECSNEITQKILLKLFKFPLLESEQWNFHTQSSEFHMSKNQNLFHTSKIGFPLYKGETMEQFTHTFATPVYWIEDKVGTDFLKDKEFGRIKKFKQNVEPRIASDDYRLVWRALTNFSNRRTLISTILPPNIFLGHSLNFLKPLIFNGKKYIKPLSYEETIFVCGMFNSFPVDFILRHRILTNLTLNFIKDLPIPEFDKNDQLHQKILKNSSMLICTTDDYSKLRTDVGISKFVTDSNERNTLEAQINACAAKIYDLNTEELEYILSTFTIISQKFKELTLDEFSLL